MSELHNTLMGRKFYESDIPRIVKALERIATALEKQEIPEEKIKKAKFTDKSDDDRGEFDSY